MPQKSSVAVRGKDAAWQRVYQYVGGCATGGECGFSAPPVLNSAYPGDERGWTQV